jgi:hypothetical protein
MIHNNPLFLDRSRRYAEKILFKTSFEFKEATLMVRENNIIMSPSSRMDLHLFCRQRRQNHACAFCTCEPSTSYYFVADELKTSLVPLLLEYLLQYERYHLQTIGRQEGRSH